MTKVHLTGELLLCLKGIFFLFSGLHVWSNISQSFDADQSIPAFVPIAQCQPSFGSGDSLNSWEFFSEWYIVILSLFQYLKKGRFNWIRFCRQFFSCRPSALGEGWGQSQGLPTSGWSSQPENVLVRCLTFTFLKHKVKIRDTD